MINKIFHFSSPAIAPHFMDSFIGTLKEKNIILQMINEWNSHASTADLCIHWKKERPNIVKYNISLLLFNVESLNTHVADVDILLSCYRPHVYMLTGVGAAIKKKNICFPNYFSFSESGTNALGGAMILYHASINCKLIDWNLNFIFMEISVSDNPIHVGGLYVPPDALLQFQLLSKHQNKKFYVFGDINDKHTERKCKNINTGGIHLLNWLENTGNELITPSKATSKWSSSIIDFSITHDASG